MPRLLPRIVSQFALLTALLVVAVNPLPAEVRAPALFGSHMVLQRGMPVPVWGWADPGEKVTVTFRDQTHAAAADAEGRWSVKLKPLDVGSPAVLTIKSSNTLTFEDVLVGEVWVCSGQSNMNMALSSCFDADLEALAATHNKVRLFQVPQRASREAQQDVEAQWTLCNSQTAPGFSAVAYYFGRQLQTVLKVPVGLIQTAWGGTRAEAWTSPSAMASHGELRPILEAWDKQAADWNPERAQAAYEQALERWQAAVAKAREQKRQPPRRPQPPVDPRLDRHHPSNLYNGMVTPLIPFAIRGAIWYQGESNAGRAYQYRTLMPAMIQSWREAWKQGDFPFYMVQLANFRAIQPEPGESDWAELREAQMLTIDALPNVGVACITDIGAAKDIHPKNKEDVGQRLARLALVDLYGCGGKLTRNGPTYESLDIVGGKCTVHFDTGGKDLITYYGEPLTGFAIAGPDKKWRWAEARISGPDTVEVWHSEVTDPVAVRYNWADNPQGDLYSAAYLPAYPFRSDDWDGVTVGKLTP